MSRTVNKIILVGEIVRDAELDAPTPDKEATAHASLATHRRKTGTDRTDWHRLVFRGRNALFAKDYLRRGARVYIEGRMHYDTYECDGVSMTTAYVHVVEVIILKRSEAASV